MRSGLSRAKKSPLPHAGSGVRLLGGSKEEARYDVHQAHHLRQKGSPSIFPPFPRLGKALPTLINSLVSWNVGTSGEWIPAGDPGSHSERHDHRIAPILRGRGRHCGRPILAPIVDLFDSSTRVEMVQEAPPPTSADRPTRRFCQGGLRKVSWLLPMLALPALSARPGAGAAGTRPWRGGGSGAVHAVLAQLSDVSRVDR